MTTIANPANPATTWLVSAALVVLVSLSYHLDSTTPDDVATAALTAQRVSELGREPLLAKVTR